MPNDEISDWAIAAAQELCFTAVEHGQLTRSFRHLAHQTPSIDEAYQILVCLAREVGLALRPNGHPGGPIGNGPLVMDRLPSSSVWTTTLAARDIGRAATMIGFAAQGDSEMVRSLALAVCAGAAAFQDGRTGIDRARATARCILLVLVLEPIDPNPTPLEGTLDVPDHLPD